MSFLLSPSFVWWCPTDCNLVDPFKGCYVGTLIETLCRSVWNFELNEAPSVVTCLTYLLCSTSSAVCSSLLAYFNCRYLIACRILRFQYCCFICGQSRRLTRVEYFASLLWIFYNTFVNRPSFIWFASYMFGSTARCVAFLLGRADATS